MVKRSILSRCAVVFVACAFLVSGCTSQYGEQQVKVNQYPQCYDPIKKLRDDENAVAKSTATGAVAGAATGAVVGGLATGSWKGAAAGAVAGGAAGAIGGNIYGKQQQKKRDAAEIARLSADLDENTDGMTRVMVAGKAAMKCYDKEFKKLIADYKAGSITKQERDERYQEIRSGLQEISYILNKKYDDMTAKDKEYAEALADDYTKAKPRKVKQSKTPSISKSSSAFKQAYNELGETKQTAAETPAAYDMVLADLDNETAARTNAA